MTQKIEEEWTICKLGERNSFPPPKKKVRICVKTKHRNEDGMPFLWQPAAIRERPDTVTILSQPTGKPNQFPISRIWKWQLL